MWVSKTKCESSRDILDSFLNPAVEAALLGGGDAIMAAIGLGGMGDVHRGCGDDDDDEGGGSNRWGAEGPGRLLCSAHFTLAEYLAGLYASVRRRVESPEWLASGRVTDSRARTLASCLEEVRKDPLAGGMG